MADTFVKNPVLLVGEKDEIVAQMGENDLGVATDVEFYTKQEVDDLVAQSGGTSLPDQTGNAGKVLTTDGTDVSWSNGIKIKEDILIGVNTAGAGTSGTNAGISIGNGASSLGVSSIGVGSAAVGWGNRTVAIGYYARANATGSIQLGTTGETSSSTRAVNNDADTFKVANHNGNFEMMDANGNIPTDRYATTPTSTGTYVPKLTIAEDGTATREWGTESGGGASLPILLSVLSDYVLNDMSWLRADTFSWQSGDVYVAAYNHLADDMSLSSSNNKMTINGTEYYVWDGGSGTDYYTRSETPVTGDDTYMLSSGVVERVKFVVVSFDGTTLRVEDENTGSTSDWSKKSLSGVNAIETIGDITIQYYQTEDGHKICMPDQESNVSALYEQTGAADYYILDTTNKQFKLPRNYQPKRTLIRMTNNADGTWYKLYSDGWVEQGGYDSTNFNTRTWTYPVAMSDTNYTLTLSVGYVNIDTQNGKFGVTSRTQTGFSYKVISLGGNAVGDNMSWRVEGYSAVQGGGVQRKYEYYYVGKFEQSAIEQTAGITAETLNGKADTDLGNIPTNYDYVVESQLPTSANGYTWYRKYKSGWVEQGGIVNAKRTAIVFPIEMSDTNYAYSLTAQSFGASNYDPCISNVFPDTLAATGFTIINQNHSSVEYEHSTSWQVSGMVAQ